MRPALLALSVSACMCIAIPACSPAAPRTALSDNTLAEARAKFEADSVAMGQTFFRSIMRRMELEVERKAADPTAPDPSIDILSISGGGDYGSFGASFLRAWGDLPPGHPMPRPDFDIVGGISTGALIAPFAFEGSDESLAIAARTYTEARPDWVQFRGLFSFLPRNASIMDITRLEREIRARVTPQVISYIAEQSEQHRILMCGSTDLDLARLHVWDLTAQARRSMGDGNFARFQDILLSSATIPIAFPAREIDGRMYADGGIIGNVLMGRDPQWVVKLTQLWKDRHPETPMPPIRAWVLVNNKARLDPQFVDPNWMPVAGRSVAASIHASTVSAIQQMWLRYRLAEVQHGVKTEFHWAAIPETFELPHVEEMFDPRVTSALAELGEKMGADPVASWQTEPPKGD
ncbi:MAG: patatin-like phospholipase family protein [Phycisphaerales bacterium]